MKDIQAIGALLLGVTLITINSLLFCAASQWVSGVAYRLGLTGAPAQWTIYVVSMFLCLGTMFTVVGRVAEGRWWFE